jgi:predicted PurR-regulated permease PerM
MTRRRLYNTLLVLLTLIATIVLLKLIWGIVGSVSDLLLTFALAWLIAFILRPVATWLSDGPPAQRLIRAIHRRWGDRSAHAVNRLLDPLAVTLIYLTLLGILIVSIVAFIPVIVSQSRQLGMNLYEYLQRAPDWVARFQTDLAQRFNVSPDLVNQFYKPNEIGTQITEIVGTMPRFVAGLIRGVASGVGQTLLILALSYYLMLDGRRLMKQIYDLLPKRFHDEYELTVSTISRAFGGFLRGQVVMAVLSGVVTAIAAGVAGLSYGAIVGAIVGLVIFIPVIGAPIAMFMPSVVALIQGLPLLVVLLLLAFLTVFQQILLHVVMPRLMSESIGMPSSLILISVLIGARLWGIWGFIFGIPVAGAIYAVGLALLSRLKREQDRLDAEQSQDNLL